MKKLLTLFIALIIACSSFGHVACENNAGDVAEGSCQHSVGADGVCILCGKDILAKWRAVFNDAKNYKIFGEREFTVNTTINSVRNVNEIESENVYIREIVKNEKNKIYTKRLNEEGIAGNDLVYENYYENLPNENIIMEYSYTNYWGGKGHDEVYCWVKKEEIGFESYNEGLTVFEMQYGIYFRYIGIFESMVPTKIEYKDEVIYVYYTVYDGMTEYVVAVKNDLIISIEGSGTAGNQISTLKIEINYDDISVVLPDALLDE